MASPWLRDPNERPDEWPAERPDDGEVGAIDLDVLQQHVAELWQHEPAVLTPTRRALLADLHQLEHEIERLALLRTAGEYVPAAATRACAARYVDLRRYWCGDDLAA